MTEINNKLLCLFEGRCWHEPDINNPDECLKCKTAFQDENGEPDICFLYRPDYATSPVDQKRLLEYLMRHGEMRFDFECFAYDKKRTKHEELSWLEFMMLPLSGSDIPRWLLLLQEWLELPETRKRFGVSICEHCGGTGRWGNDIDWPITPCLICNGTGKVLSEWAWEVKEG